MPTLKKNLTSLGTLESKGSSFGVKDGALKVSKGVPVLIKSTRVGNNLYKVMGDTVVGGAAVSPKDKSREDESQLWHMCLRHVSEKGMLELHKRELLIGAKACKLGFCKSRVLGKQKKVSFKTASNNCRSKSIINYIHSNVWGPSLVKTRWRLLGYYLVFRFCRVGSSRLARTENKGQGYFSHYVCDFLGV